MNAKYIPTDVREDIKVGKIFTLNTLLATFIVMFIVLILAVFLPVGPIAKILIFFLPTLLTLGIFTAEVPKHLKNFIEYLNKRNSLSELDELSNIEEFGTKSTLSTGDESVYLEIKEAPWEICPDKQKERRAQEFAADVVSMLVDGATVSLYGTCTGESTKHLEDRYKKLSELPEGLRNLENRRIEHHYKISKQAQCTKYTMQVARPVNEQEGIEEIITTPGTYLGEDIIQELVNNQLTPSAFVQRGGEDEQEDIEEQD